MPALACDPRYRVARANASVCLPKVFINSKYRNVYGGRATTDEEITGFLIATLFAGQHTSSITSSWTGFFMLTNQVWHQQQGLGCSCI